MSLTAISIILLPISLTARNYVKGTVRMTWSEAKAFCDAEYAGLATITTPSENGQAQQVCFETLADVGCWTGLNARSNPCTWEWDDGTAVDYGFLSQDGAQPTGVAPWKHDYPNNCGSQHCMAIGGAYPSTLWDDGTCSLDNNVYPLCNAIPCWATDANRPDITDEWCTLTCSVIHSATSNQNCPPYESYCQCNF